MLGCGWLLPITIGWLCCVVFCVACACRFIDGYTIRTLTLKGLILQDVAPPLDEISRFNAAGQPEADDMNVSGTLQAVLAGC